ncbi:hypothetical protein [Streptomyces sp. SAJ15]|uniref:hypothetical protein n=1 Tax=Streptomyces sp. SAJ15 TaxID=2011095 RepID=UPI001184AFCD|nr:hypothetical protein [Streptomyces sp. SAJ15]TVL90153.1 hypothetical protein CD790_23750 [Streptomyces sp. SAJ15]
MSKDSFYTHFREADFGPLDTLATKWQEVYDGIKDLDDDVRDDVLKPLKDKGYWEGAAAPYAWAQIDDIQRQITAAAKVVEAVKKAMVDGVGELKAAQKNLNEAVKRFATQGLTVKEKDDGTLEVTTSEKAKDEKSLQELNKKIKDASDELGDLLRVAFQADQNLSITLMENVGLDEWFNTQKLRTDINSTADISVDRYDALGRDMKGLDPYPSPNNQTPRGLAGDWVTGSGEKVLHFSQHDKFIEQLRQSPSMAKIRDDTLTAWYKGEGEGHVKHSLSELSKPALGLKYVKDMTGLSGVDNLWGGKTNEAESLLGSYDVYYSVKSQEPDGSIVVQYELKNDTDMESFLPGYSKSQEALNHENGPARDIKERMVWTERIDPNDWRQAPK